MTTMAQRLLESDWVGGPPNSIGNLALTFVKTRLRGSKNLLLPSGPITDGVCERFAFTEDAPGLMIDLISSGTLDREAVWDQARMPAPICWIEWRTVSESGIPVNFGALLDTTLRIAAPKLPGVRHTTIVLCADSPTMEREGLKPAPVFLGELPADMTATSAGLIEIGDAPPQWLWAALDDADSDTLDRMYHEGFTPDDWSYERKLSLYYSMIKSVAYALFLIVTPRVCDVRTVDYAPKLQARRKKDRKEPLIEYRKVTIRVGGSVRYIQSEKRGHMSAAEEAAQRRKFHHVIGHFRTYHRGRTKQRIAWIEDHWRGDPELGIILHEREVRR